MWVHACMHVCMYVYIYAHSPVSPMRPNDTKEVLVLVHGYLGGSAQWHRQLEALAANFRVVAPTLPGYAQHARMESPHTIEGYADYVVSVLDGERVERFHLLGHSMGGMIAQEIAVRIPTRVKTLVLYATGPVGVMPGRFESVAESQGRLRVDGPSRSARRIGAKWLSGGAASVHYEACAALAVQASAQAAHAGLSAMQAWSGSEKLQQIRSPTLVLWGDCDRCYASEPTLLMCRRVVGATLRIVHGGSHAVHVETPALFNSIVCAFLSLHCPSGAAAAREAGSVSVAPPRRRAAGLVSATEHFQT